MKIYFDHQLFNIQKFGGGSNYIVNLVENLSSNLNPLIISPFYKNHYLKKCKKSHKFFQFNKLGYLSKYSSKFNQFYFDFFSKFNKPDIIHYSYFNEKIIYKTQAKTVITEFDLIKEKFYNKDFKDQIEFKNNLFKKIDKIICISENTKKDLLNIYNLDSSKISVIHLAVKKDKNYREKFLKLNPFILFVGSRARYKNFKNFLIAFSTSTICKKNLDIVCFGDKKFSKEEEDLFKKLSISRKKIHHFIGDELDLNFFYKEAKAFIYPSLYEGFGIPLLEAMNMDCPVACSNTSSFPEIAGKAAEYFNPNNTESIKLSIEKIINSQEISDNLIKEGKKNLQKFSWIECAKKTEELYYNLKNAT